MHTDMTYGGFWRRFGAFWLDALFLSPLSVFVFWASSYSRLFNLWYFIPSLVIGLFYNVWLVKRLGATPGKLVAGLRIAKVDGSPIGYQEALIRFSPEFLLGVLMSVAILMATMRMSDAEYLSLGFMQRSVRLVGLTPSWFKPVQWIQNIWIWGEFIVLLTNKKRRAIHDFIAGTVVVRRNPNQSSDPTLPPVLSPAGQDPSQA